MAEENTLAHRETFGHLIDVTLDRDALDAKKNRLVAVDKEIAAISAEKAAAVAEFNKELKDMRKEQSTLLDTISSGAAKLELQCYNERDDRRGMMLTRRSDTGEIVDERALTAEERGQAAEDRQGNLFEAPANSDALSDGEEPEERGDEDTENALAEYAAQSAAAGESNTSTGEDHDEDSDEDEDDIEPTQGAAPSDGDDSDLVAH